MYVTDAISRPIAFEPHIKRPRDQIIVHVLWSKEGLTHKITKESQTRCSKLETNGHLIHM